MGVLDKLLSSLAPYDCLACGQEGDLLCTGCRHELKPRPDPWLFLDVVRAQTATIYEGVAKDLLWKLKSEGAKTAASIMAAEMARRLEFRQGWLIVPLPTATTRLRQRGYDQAKLLACELSRQTGLAYLDCLARLGKSHQVGASRQNRLKQLENAFWLKPGYKVKGQRLILVDDVITTGASMESAICLLNDSGAADMEAAAFAWTSI